jgi:hypothetical protein
MERISETIFGRLVTGDDALCKEGFTNHLGQAALTWAAKVRGGVGLGLAFPVPGPIQPYAWASPARFFYQPTGLPWFCSSSHFFSGAK